MALTEAEDLRVSSEVYEALTRGEEAKVIEICAGIPKGPLHTPTIHDDTVLSLATNLKKNDLALQLLDMVPMCDSHKLTWQNSGGHTMLHETGLNNKTVEAAAEMLARAPMLLGMTNRLGETALFTAASNGKTKIFNLLHRQVCRTTQGPDLKTFLQRDDKSTILHRAILSRNYCKHICSHIMVFMIRFKAMKLFQQVPFWFHTGSFFFGWLALKFSNHSE
ncbi:putative ankyrin repeat-containing domain superfamily [Helianthus debilis subsp. tardiflorus]